MTQDLWTVPGLVHVNTGTDHWFKLEVKLEFIYKVHLKQTFKNKIKF